MNSITNEEIGRRLIEFRKALSAETGTEWSQRRLAKQLSLTQNVILRAEKGMGSLHNIVRLLLFYHSRGYSMNWVLVPDNSHIPMKKVSPEEVQEEMGEKMEKIQSLQLFIQGLEL